MRVGARRSHGLPGRKTGSAAWGGPKEWLSGWLTDWSCAEVHGPGYYWLRWPSGAEFFSPRRLVPRRQALHDNTNIDVRCRALWAEVLSALESRITSVNQYVPEKRSHIVFHLIDSEAIHLQHASSERSVVASLDLKQHAIHLHEYHDREMKKPLQPKDLPLSMLADGELYVTDGNELKANPMEVAKSLLERLLATKAATATTPMTA